MGSEPLAIHHIPLTTITELAFVCLTHDRGLKFRDVISALRYCATSSIIFSTVQRISPEGSSKIQIQIVLHDGNSFTFQFTSEPAAAAKKERDEAKDLLAQLIPAHRKKANRELEEKNRCKLSTLKRFYLACIDRVW